MAVKKIRSFYFKRFYTVNDKQLEEVELISLGVAEALLKRTKWPFPGVLPHESKALKTAKLKKKKSI